jgi:acyl-coenzyme A synthetase/AMP-(fatty) acid ligase
MNIIEPILFQVRFQPEAPALLRKEVISYAVLTNQMKDVARRAIGYGLKRGDVVAISSDQPMVEAALVLGPSQIGIVARRRRR